MPASEQTFYNMKVLHIVFGVSTLVLTLTTIWLIAKDHNREWKMWQLADRRKEAWTLAAQRDALTDQVNTKITELREELQSVRCGPIGESQLKDFKSLVRSEDERLQTLGADYRPLAFSDLETAADASQDATEGVRELADGADGPGGQEIPEDDAGAKDRAGAEQASDRNHDLAEARQRAIAARGHLFETMDTFIAEAKRRENLLVVKKKFIHADRTAAVSELGIQVGGGAQARAQEATQNRIDQLDDRLADLADRVAQAKSYRTALEGVVANIDAKPVALEKELRAIQIELDRLHEQEYLNSTNPGEWITRLPVLDALYDGNIRIDQIWLPDLTINYNFSQVARFDRCKTCHRAIAKTSPDTRSDPAYPTLEPEKRDFFLSLPTPGDAPGEQKDLKSVYGLVLSDLGIMGTDEVTVRYVIDGSLAAKAGIRMGDSVRSVGEAAVDRPEQVAQLLMTPKDHEWGDPLSIGIHRGLDHPFTSHPRLDLYMTDLSPHPEMVFGCTICHDGQGSGTDFKWASHMPDNARQQRDWRRQYDWFDNHHWIFPMKPRRFIESNCTKCHHGKAELQASESFPETPAPKLVEGWTLVEQFGCFGCHEINGFDGPSKRIGPDLRREPNYHEVAARILHDDQLTEQERLWARRLARSPADFQARQGLLRTLGEDVHLAKLADPKARLSSATRTLVEGLQDVENPGQYRKAGPSLRFIQSKVDFDWIARWIHKPLSIRPATRMPQVFGQWEHLQDDPKQLDISQQFESIEIRAMAEYLLAHSSQFEYLVPPAEVNEPASVERGRWLFESRGCLACHSHRDYPEIAAELGPDLSHLSAKLSAEDGRKWLYSWLKEPQRVHARTKMPEMFLDPIAEKDITGKPIGKATGKIIDPAADIVAYLLSVESDTTTGGEAPIDGPIWHMTPAETEALAKLALEWLASDKISEERAVRYLRDGIPAHWEPRLKEAERLLIGINDENRQARQLKYVARKTIGKYGCFGCHDIPGFELAKPIGTALAGWGRKDPLELASENILQFLKGGHAHLDPIDFDPDTSHFIQSLNSHARDGFIWQKLRMPRSYDYKTTRNKGYNERLRMPRFPLKDHQREAIITFVLGLVSEPPAEKFVFHPDARQEAIFQGRQVLEKFNCAGCHTMRTERWDLRVDEETFESPSEVTDYPFLDVHFSEKERVASMERDRGGLTHATIHGMPVVNEETGKVETYDEDLLPLEEGDDESDPFYLFTLWRDALVGDAIWKMGVQDLMVPASRSGYGPASGKVHLAWGGELTRYLYPKVIEHARQENPRVKGAEAWGWLPPVLEAEGDKVQTDWLHGFLIDPFPIRPAVVMRMPNFHMDSGDAEKLVHYFAASSGARFQYEFKKRRRASYLEAREAHHPGRMDAAMDIVTDGNYCVKCHAVADFSPRGEAPILGPDLAGVSSRLRSDYIRNWIANPKGILPYTGMPVNISYDPDSPHLGGISQDLFQGTSLEQLDGLVDLLMNFDTYTRRQTSIESLVQPAAEPAD